MMSDYCEEHEENGLDLIDPKRMFCPDCEHERLSDIIDTLKRQVADLTKFGAVMTREHNNSERRVQAALDFIHMAGPNGDLDRVRKILEQTDE